MSGENAQVVRRAIDRFVAGDIDGLAEAYALDTVVTAPEGWPEAGQFEGRDAAMRQFARLQEDWVRHSMRVEEEKSGGDWVVLKQRWSTEGAASGLPLEMTVVGAYRIEGEQIAEARFFWDWEEALEAAGLGA